MSSVSRHRAMCLPVCPLLTAQAETVDLLVTEGQNSLNDWASICAEKCVPGAMSAAELRWVGSQGYELLL